MLTAKLRLAVVAAVMFSLRFALSVGAQTLLTGTVTNVVDGDTIKVLTQAGQNSEIRLEGIDAPESRQALGAESTKNLANLVSGKTVNLTCTGIDQYSRLTCTVRLPSGEDVDLEQIQAGMAWHYKQFQSLQSAIERQEYGAAEDVARRAHIGLWADAHPVQPQDFRHGTHSEICLDSNDHRIACSELYDGPVRGNMRSHIYHWPGCPNYNDIADHNRVEFLTAVAAEQAGYRAARNCP
jgi:endonuclease YncB( thermonuclease family)